MTFEYFKKIYEILEIVEEKEYENIIKTKELLLKTVENKNSIYIFGASHAGILTQEMFYRAGGLININPIFGKEIMLDTEPITLTSKMERLLGYGKILSSKINFNKDDVLILHSVSGRNPVTIEMAIEAKKKDVKIIVITNLTYSKSTESRHPSGKLLYELGDIVIDNHGDIGDASCSIKGIEQKVGPTSTVVGATILNTIVVELCNELVNKGVEYPPIFYSANLDGGDELNKKLYEQYKDTIHYKF